MGPAGEHRPNVMSEPVPAPDNDLMGAPAERTGLLGCGDGPAG